MVNKVILVGNVGSDPEVRTFEDGGKMARVNIATNERIYNPSTQESRDHTEWHSLIFNRRTSNVVEMYVRKGSQIYVEGKLRTRQWEDENKIRRYSTEVHVDELRLLGRRGDNDRPAAPASGYDGGYNAPAQQQYSQPQQQSYGGTPAASYTAPAPSYAAPAPETPAVETTDGGVDDLPF